MAYSIKKSEIIDYPPEQLKEFEIMAYEWIDNLNFTINPKDCIENADEYISIAKQRFLDDGWDGDEKKKKKKWIIETILWKVIHLYGKQK